MGERVRRSSIMGVRGNRAWDGTAEEESLDVFGR